VILVFYPRRYCAACLDLQRVAEDHRDRLEAGGPRLVGVAEYLRGDEAGAQGTGAPVTFLADEDGAVARLYGVPRLLPGKPKHPTSPITVVMIDRGGQIAWSGPAVVDGQFVLEHLLEAGGLAGN
jgi:peroxiredoxin